MPYAKRQEKGSKLGSNSAYKQFFTLFEPAFCDYLKKIFIIIMFYKAKSTQIQKACFHLYFVILKQISLKVDDI